MKMKHFVLIIIIFIYSSKAIAHSSHYEGLKKIEGVHSDFTYKLGLSATPERIFDEEGTDFIKQEMKLKEV